MGFAAPTSPPSYSSARHDCAATNSHRICGRNLSPHPLSSASVSAVIPMGLTAVMPGVGGYRSRRNQKENLPPSSARRIHPPPPHPPPLALQAGDDDMLECSLESSYGSGGNRNMIRDRGWLVSPIIGRR